MIRALIFDFDGLIIDSERAVYRAWCDTFAEYGVEFPLELWLPMVGTRELDDAPWRALLKLTGRTDIDRTELEAAKRARSLELANRLPALPGVVALIEAASSAGTTLAIASSSSAWWVEGHLKRLSLRDHFSAVCTAEQAGPGKPAPDVYLAALAGLGVAPSDAIAFEDSEHGIAAAKAAGIRVIAIPGSFSDQMTFSAADIVVGSLEEVVLEKLLERLG